MLIGVDASRAVSDQPTGTETYSRLLIQALVRQGGQHRFRLYFNREPPDGCLPRGGRVEWRVMPFPRLWTHVRLMWEVLRHPPDVLYVPAHVLPWLHPDRCVATIHDLGFLHYPEAHKRLARWYLDWSTRFNARTASRVIADSCATRDDLVSFYGIAADKITVAYPAGSEGLAPVNDVALRARIQERYGIGPRYFLHVGTLQPRKNLSTLIMAFGSLIRDTLIPSDVQLVLAGKRGWLAGDILERASDPSLAGRVILPGYVEREYLPTLLSGAIAYVLPSWYEGFGLPVLEAMACDAPIICSNVSSLPEVAGDAALLVDPVDVEAWTQAMSRVYCDADLRAELVRRGRERWTHFSWDRCARIVLDALEATGSER
jgi:glycosyltransferase involved in cell wall biosynthesis